MKVETLKDIERAMINLWYDDEKYATTLIGPRTRGSKTKKPLFNVVSTPSGPEPRLAVKNRPVYYVGEGEKGAKIYKAVIHELGGMVDVFDIGSLDHGEIKQVRLRWGSHGPELYLPNSGIRGIPCETITFIVGPDETLWTWHPGPALKPLDMNTAVKFE